MVPMPRLLKSKPEIISNSVWLNGGITIMKIAILGSGAMGTVLGAFLVKNGCEVDFIDTYQAHVDALNQSGAHIIGTVDFTVPVRAITPEQMDGIYDVVFLFTKQTANPSVLPGLLTHLDENSTVCTLQNGVPEPYIAEYIGVYNFTV